MAGIGNPDTWSLGQQDTVIAALERAVAKHSDRVLLDFSGELHTYGEVDRQSTRLAHAFAALGVQPGQTVVTMLDNNIDAVLCWFAINKLCAVSVPINTALKGEFLRHQIADAGAALVVCEAAYAERIAAVCDAVRYVTRAGIAGAYVECGVWRGGSSMAAALGLMAADNRARDLYLFDTFEGMSEPSF